MKETSISIWLTHGSVPGIPCIYYGSEWGIKGEKIQGVTDAPLCPELDAPQPNELSDFSIKIYSYA